MVFAVYCNRGVRWITRFSGIRAHLEQNEAVVAAVLVLAGYSGHETKSGGHGSRKKSFGDREIADFSLECGALAPLSQPRLAAAT